MHLPGNFTLLAREFSSTKLHENTNNSECKRYFPFKGALMAQEKATYYILEKSSLIFAYYNLAQRLFVSHA